MNNNQIYPVILCGGQGTRLWPLSRKAMPKQFAKINAEFSLLQTTVQRMEDSNYMPPILLTNEDYRFSVREQLEEIGVKWGENSASILIEPEARNTAPSICAAAQYLSQINNDALMLIAPSDHMIEDQLALMEAINQGMEKAKQGHVVTFGIRPDRPETGYGYIEMAQNEEPHSRAIKSLQFIEKPNLDGAEKMLEAGNYVWNAGIFLISVKTAIKLFAQYQPKINHHVKLSVTNSKEDLEFTRLSNDYSKSENISFDYAIMENEPGYVIPIDPNWTDLGDWRSVWKESEKDSNGVAKSDHAMAIDCEDCLLRSENENLSIVGVGLKNITAIATRDAVLVCDLNETQSVSVAVNQLREMKVKQADEFPRHDRPWGHYETLSLGPRFQVKSIVVNPNQKLSLQSHVHRSEHWVVVEGTATVTVGNIRKLIGENASIYIPQGETHRLENEGKLPLQLIEVQTGCYLGEDDIIRYEDVYARA